MMWKSPTQNESGLLTSSGLRDLGPIQINSGWNVQAGHPGPQSGAAPPDQIRTGAAGPVNQSERRPARLRAARGWEAMWGGGLVSDRGWFTSSLCLKVCTYSVAAHGLKTVWEWDKWSFSCTWFREFSKRLKKRNKRKCHTDIGKLVSKCW